MRRNRSGHERSLLHTAGRLCGSGGGAVVLNVGRYMTTGTLTVKRGVVLCGATHGPFDVEGVNPATTTVAATLLVTVGYPTTFLTLEGLGAGVTDILFHYPNQNDPTASAPVPYGFTVKMAQAGTKIERCTVTNAYQFLDIEVGRTIAKDLFIGAFLFGVYVDHAADRVMLSNIVHSVFWDIAYGASYPQTIDQWVLDNGYAFVILRADSVQIHDSLVFSRYAGFYLTDSPDTELNPRNGYGLATNIDIDTCQYGIIARSTNGPGLKFANLDIGAHATLGEWGVAYEAGGLAAPVVLINGGSIRGSWAGGRFMTFPSPAKLFVEHVIGHTYP